ncbi:MAG: hypothetical protein VW226_09480, partial [Rhodospirillaceae bacterium]
MHKIPSADFFLICFENAWIHSSLATDTNLDILWRGKNIEKNDKPLTNNKGFSLVIENSKKTLKHRQDTFGSTALNLSLFSNRSQNLNQYT